MRWYQYDPTKWFIGLCSVVRLTTHLKIFPENEIRKGRLTMRLKELKKEQDALEKPIDLRELPVVDWDTCEFSPFCVTSDSQLPVSPVYAAKR